MRVLSPEAGRWLCFGVTAFKGDGPMGCDVYANGDEIACKAGSGKVIAGFPDVCLTPPPPPAVA